MLSQFANSYDESTTYEFNQQDARMIVYTLAEKRGSINYNRGVSARDSRKSLKD